MFTIVDFNNFWSPSGGGVRRYHLQKMAFYERQNEVRSVFVMPSASTYTETRSDGLIIEHVEAFRFPGNWEYRFMWKSKQIRPILEKYKPDRSGLSLHFALGRTPHCKKGCPQSRTVQLLACRLPRDIRGPPRCQKIRRKRRRIHPKNCILVRETRIQRLRLRTSVIERSDGSPQEKRTPRPALDSARLRHRHVLAKPPRRSARQRAQGWRPKPPHDIFPAQALQ